MIIWILKASEPTPYDARTSGTRPFRYGLLTAAAVEAGHSVLWWTDDFNHATKVHRFGKDQLVEVGPSSHIQFVFTPGYRRNASLRRFRDHSILARRIENLAAAHPLPNVILAGMPSDHLCAAAVRLGRRLNVPVVLDVRDLWPDVFHQHAPSWMRPFVRLATLGFERRVRRSFRGATGIVGNTDAFVRWGLDKAGRERTDLDRAFPVGFARPKLSDKQVAAARTYWSGLGVDEDDGCLKVCFLGALSGMYDFEPVLHAAKSLSDDGVRAKFILCGSGPLEEELAARAAALPNVILPGWVPAVEAWTLMQMCSIGLAPYRDDPNFRLNFPNKPAEYLAAGLPVFVGVRGAISDFVSRHSCGSAYKGGEELAGRIRDFAADVHLREAHRNRAVMVFDNFLEAANIYPEFVAHLERIAQLGHGADNDHSGGDGSPVGIIHPEQSQ